jgi:hypothetical protein
VRVEQVSATRQISTARAYQRGRKLIPILYLRLTDLLPADSVRKQTKDNDAP